ncbi:hypothetical protein L6452_20262 [Arctium lappa]|uniref:Uncharacterized protein n=1 Tax=Arctium lappa TaxID=4217 RepID=A0ACB9BF94_ARCLA|nr:hypothetical protein L6452_20262 [Arctium lappa]
MAKLNRRLLGIEKARSATKDSCKLRPRAAELMPVMSLFLYSVTVGGHDLALILLLSPYVIFLLPSRLLYAFGFSSMRMSTHPMASPGSYQTTRSRVSRVGSKKPYINISRDRHKHTQFCQIFHSHCVSFNFIKFSTVFLHFESSYTNYIVDSWGLLLKLQTSLRWKYSIIFEATGSVLSLKNPKVIFVLGGPGSGKGTQCSNIVEHFGYTHLSAGDLLRAEIKSGSENGTMIQNMIKEGKIVPSEVTIKLLEKAIAENENDKFLIDGFPRNEENRAAFESVTGIVPEFVLFFDCPEEEMEKRLLGRNQGREDDNIDTIRKRFRVYMESSLPVIEYYKSKEKVRKIDAAKPVEEVFEAVKALFTPVNDKIFPLNKIYRCYLGVISVALNIYGLIFIRVWLKYWCGKEFTMRSVVDFM